MSRFHLANEDSSLVSVSTLWPLAKVSDYTEASCYTPWANRYLRFVHEKLQLRLGLVVSHWIVSGVA